MTLKSITNFAAIFGLSTGLGALAVTAIATANPLPAAGTGACEGCECCCGGACDCETCDCDACDACDACGCTVCACG